ncbi:MAG: hypothetical protein ACRC10_12000 [Thermoguttaceae bacterium]
MRYSNHDATMMKIDKTNLDEVSMLRQLEKWQIDFSPFELVSVQVLFDKNFVCSPDALIRLQWSGKAFNFSVQSKTRSDSLKVVKVAIEQASRYAQNVNDTQYYPMIYVPYLSSKAVDMLKDTQVCGVDLCGNLFITIPGEVYVERIGKPNRFPSSAPIKNIYQNNSSLVPRLFLLQPRFDSITAVVRELKHRNGILTQATVSKICQSLEKDLIIEKREIRNLKKTFLIQPETLLANLTKGYVSPIIRQRTRAKLRISRDDLVKRLIQWSRATKEKIVQTGIVSCTMYTIMVREEMTAFYCSNVERLLSEHQGILEETNRFADVELFETNDQTVYFDERESLCASPIQSYLELMQGDKRDRQGAETIAQNLLEEIRQSLKKQENN